MVKTDQNMFDIDRRTREQMKKAAEETKAMNEYAKAKGRVP